MEHVVSTWSVNEKKKIADLAVSVYDAGANIYRAGPWRIVAATVERGSGGELIFKVKAKF